MKSFVCFCESRIKRTMIQKMTKIITIVHREFGDTFQPSSGRPGEPRADMPMSSSGAARGMQGLWICPWTAPGTSGAAQKLFRGKDPINAFILWKLRPVFKKCSWSTWSIHWLHITHTCSLRITPARKSPESIDSAIQLRVTWMTSLSQCSRRCGLAKNIKNLPGFCGFCSLAPSRLNFKLFVNTLTFCGCIRLPEAMR